MTDGWPLVGRTAELARVLDRIRGDGDGPNAVVVTGEPGVGKTRLTTEARRQAEAMGMTTARVVATGAARSIPFGAFAPLLPRSDEPLEGRLDRVRWAIEALAAIPPAGDVLVLVIDDASLLDDGSANLVAAAAAEPWCRLVLTVRTGEPAPDVITGLWENGLALRLELGALPPADAEQLIAALLATAGPPGQSAPIEAATVRRLLSASRGNALYLRELVLGSVDAGGLSLEHGLWRLRSEMAAPARLVELVASRLDGLDAHTQRAVEYLAVADHLGLAHVETLAGADGVTALTARGLVEVVPEGRRQQVRLAHPLYGEVLRRQLGAIANRSIRRSLAGAVQGFGGRRREDLLQVATWQLDAGVATDPDLLLGAARQAQLAFDTELTERLATAALAAGAGVPAGLLVVESYFERGRWQEAEEALAQLEVEAVDDDQVARVANARAHNLMNSLDRMDDAAEVLATALVRVTDPTWQSLLRSRLAILHLFAGRPAAVIETAAPMLAASDQAAIVRAAYAAGLAYAELGRYRDAVVASDKGYAAQLAARAVTVQPVEGQLIARALALADAGGLAEASELARQAHASIVGQGHLEGQATWAMILGVVAVGTGDVEAADGYFREGAAVNREINDPLALRWCLGGLALVAGLRADPVEAETAVAELRTMPPPTAMLMAHELVARGQAWARAAGGEFSAARAELLATAEGAAQLGKVSIALTLLHDVVRLGEASPAVVEQLASLAGRVDGDAVLPAAKAAHAAGLAAADAATVESAAARFDQCGARLLAAEAYADAARLYRASSLVAASAAAARRAGELAASCPGAKTPGLVDLADPGAGVATAIPLTAREREIAALAARGLSSKDIAARLSVAVRTVDNHLQRVYLKLGVSGRDSLGEVLSEQ